MAFPKFEPPVIAHRGASAYAPENTIASFTKAALLGVKWVEFDVMLTKTGETVIFHDDLLDRTTNGSGMLSQFSYAYLQTLDAGSWFDPRFSSERIPTLNQVMALLSDIKMNANIEIKPQLGQEEELVKRVVNTISDYLNDSRITLLFSSFSIEALRFLRNYLPECNLGLLLDEWRVDWQEIATELNCVSVHVNHQIMTEDAVQQIKSRGMAALCYTINNPFRAEELYALGVDALFSDAPDNILKMLK